MQEFGTYLRLGFEHLLDLNAPDHILFILMLTLPYELKEWQKLFWLATAFTLGHSLTLAISVYTEPKSEFIAWIEFFIAFSIALTAFFQLFNLHFQKSLYAIIVVFGLIHGYGFSGMLKSLLEGLEFQIWNTLLPFNLGLEIAQVLWMSIILTINTWFKYPTKLKFIIYFLTMLVSIYWMYERVPI